MPPITTITIPYYYYQRKGTDADPPSSARRDVSIVLVLPPLLHGPVSQEPCRLQQRGLRGECRRDDTGGAGSCVFTAADNQGKGNMLMLTRYSSKAGIDLRWPVQPGGGPPQLTPPDPAREGWSCPSIESVALPPQFSTTAGWHTKSTWTRVAARTLC